MSEGKFSEAEANLSLRWTNYWHIIRRDSNLHMRRISCLLCAGTRHIKSRLGRHYSTLVASLQCNSCWVYSQPEIPFQLSWWSGFRLLFSLLHRALTCIISIFSTARNNWINVIIVTDYFLLLFIQWNPMNLSCLLTLYILFQITVETLKFLYFKQTVQTLIRRRFLGLPCPSPTYKDNPVYTALWRHNDPSSAAINNRYLITYKRTVWFPWSMIITWTTTSKKFWCLYTMARL